MKKAFGFTLIELMIAVAVIGILAAVALPVYDDAMRKSRRRAAEAFMMDVAQREQAILLDRRSFVAVAADEDGDSTYNENFPAALNLPAPGEISLYVVRVDVVASPPSFTITAEATGKQDYKNSEDLVLRSNGTKGRGDADTNSFNLPW